MFFFFFSSRRRHTRFDCDWSSDVCSSDLFIELVKTASDEQIVEAIHAAGTERALEGIFAGMKESFRPERAGDQDADIIWVVVDDGEEHPCTLAIHGGACEARKGAAESPTVTLTADL